jgi:hypothetical protein
MLSTSERCARQSAKTPNTRFWLARNKIASRHPAMQIGGSASVPLTFLVTQRDAAHRRRPEADFWSGAASAICWRSQAECLSIFQHGRRAATSCLI